MEKFTLEILFHLIGIGSAGFYQGDSLFIVSDNSGFYMNTPSAQVP
jgi:hypothetical protein